MQYGPKIVTNGLVLCLDAADRNSYSGSGTSWIDLSGNGGDGTLTNGPTFNSGSGGNIIFDGINDYINCTTLNTALFSTEASLVCWLKCNSNIPATLESGIFGFENTSLRSHYVWPVDVRGYFGTFRANRVGPITLSSINRTIPHMLAITTKGGGLWKLYQNTTLVTSTAAEATVSIASGNRYIGTKNALDGYLFKGSIYSFALYNRELSVSELTQNYNTMKGRFDI